MSEGLTCDRCDGTDDVRTFGRYGATQYCRGCQEKLGIHDSRLESALRAASAQHEHCLSCCEEDNFPCCKDGCQTGRDEDE